VGAAVSLGCAAEPCSVSTDESGAAVITCPDGTSSVIEPGVSGEDGENGAPALLRLGDATLADCPNGGTEVLSGLDLDGDGSLSDDEVTASEAVCDGAPAVLPTSPSVVDGTVVINSSLDLPALEGVTAITGDLIINAPGMTSVSLPSLTTIGRHLYADYGADVSTLDLPALTFVGGDVDLETMEITGLSGLAALDTVGGTLRLVNNDVLVSLGGLVSLTSVAALDVHFNDVLSDIGLPALGYVANGFSVYSNPNLPACEVDALSLGLIAPPTSFANYGNDDAATCP